MSEKMRMLLLRCFIAVIILLGTYNRFFSLCGFLLVSYLIIRENENCVSILMFVMPMAAILKLSPGSTSLFTYIELLYVVTSIFKRNFRISHFDVGIICFIFYEVIMQTIMTGSINITTTLKMAAHLLIFSSVVSNVDSNKENAFLSYVYGVVASSLMALFDGAIFRISEYVITKEIRIDGAMIGRFAGLYGDPNYYAVNVIIALCLIIILVSHGKMNKAFAVGLSILLAVFSGMTGSKSALLMLVFPLLLFVLIQLHNGKYVSAMISIVIGIILVFLTISGSFEVFNNIIYRLSNTTDVQSLTTGRSEYWKDYFSYFKADMVRLLFGNSINNITLHGHAAHNTYIDILYQLGIVGGIWFLKIVISIGKNAKEYFIRSAENYSVLFVILMMYFFLSELQYYDMFYHFILCYMVMNYTDSESEYICEEI